MFDDNLKYVLLFFRGFLKNIGGCTTVTGSNSEGS